MLPTNLTHTILLIFNNITLNEQQGGLEQIDVLGTHVTNGAAHKEDGLRGMSLGAQPAAGRTWDIDEVWLSGGRGSLIVVFGRW